MYDIYDREDDYRSPRRKRLGEDAGDIVVACIVIATVSIFAAVVLKLLGVEG